MRTQAYTFALGMALGVLGNAAPALAQYKNSSFGLDAGGWFISKPSAISQFIDDCDEGEVPPCVRRQDNRPLRLTNGLRVGGETNFKMDSDHVWFTARVNLGVLQFPQGDVRGSLDEQHDAAARRTLGTLLGVQGSMGVRYTILTDKVRPYLQGALSYMRLFTFSSLAEEGCGDDFLCGDGSTNEESYLPHPNVGGFHVQPGVEIIIHRDAALHFFLDMQRWIIFNADDNNAIVIGAGMVFFT